MNAFLRGVASILCLGGSRRRYKPISDEEAMRRDYDALKRDLWRAYPNGHAPTQEEKEDWARGNVMIDS